MNDDLLYRVEYAKSNRSKCQLCEQFISKLSLRLAVVVQSPVHDGKILRWYHFKCFFFKNKPNSTSDIACFDEIRNEDQDAIREKLEQSCNAPPPSKKRKRTKGDGSSGDKTSQGDVPPPKKKYKTEGVEEAKLIKKQNEDLYTIKDKISSLTKKEMIALLKRNHQKNPGGTSNITSLLSDILYFGALLPCPKCEGQLIYNSGLGYKCTGNTTEWTKCEYVTQDPKRKKCEIPSDTKEDFPIKSYTSIIKRRIFKITMPSSMSFIKKEDETDGPNVQGKPRPLKNMQFVILGRTHKNKKELEKEILDLGGTITVNIHRDLAAVISNQDELKKMNRRMEDVKSYDIQVITEDFIEEAKEYTDAPIMLLKNKTISSWGGDINVRLSNVFAKSSAFKSKSRFEKSSSGKVKVTVKSGGAVDPDSGLENNAHIYRRGKDEYTVTLSRTDIQSKKNSYYTMQILKLDNQESYYLFRKWGRIGTKIEDKWMKEMVLETCIAEFESLYKEKTGNQWQNRENFVKVPMKYQEIDIDHGDQEIAFLNSDIKSNLKKPIQDLMRLIFDVDQMKKILLEYELDMDKMPLGKLSKKQIKKAYDVLTELQEILKKSDIDRTTLIAASNKFYTLIPHNFGISDAKILETSEDIQNKCDMLNALLEMKFTYNLLCETDFIFYDKTNEENPLDSHYKQLKTDIDILDKTSEEFKMIEKYVKNTHAATHSQYTLEIEEVFIVKRQDEEERFKKLPNRKLLWHGSRTTNYAGILSQGLRIAPPEVPASGYMFGKGLYFADMVSKAANYCCTHSQSPTGLLLLCEVALGNMYERYQADYIEKLPKGKHSTVGWGRTHPDPQNVYTTEDGVEVPYGKGVPANHNKNPELLYNEYIVYDVAQVKVRYLLKMNFKYKY